MLVPVPALAQAPVTEPAAAEVPAADQTVEFSADQVVYDGNNETVTASGEVRMNREGNDLAADQVVWDRSSGQVRATGNVVLLTPQGDKVTGENVQLTDTFRDGTIDNLMVVLESGGRLAATRGTRANGVGTFYNAIYSPCPVTSPSGCPKRPSWSVTAARVIDDPKSSHIRFEGARFQLFGLNLPLLPVFNIAKGNGGITGLLVPDIALSSRNGLEFALPYHWQLSRNRDLTIAPHVYTAVLPAIDVKYRELNSLGAFQVSGFLTYGTIDSTTNAAPTARGFRGYFDANGRWQLDPAWTVTASFRVASDKTVTRRYDITNDDRLRNVVNAERITPNSYVSIAGWVFQGLRADDQQKQIPIALPAIDARFRLDDFAGGHLQLQANSLAIRSSSLPTGAATSTTPTTPKTRAWRSIAA